MELEGSDAFIVLDDTDLDHTVAMLGRFGNGGTCISSKRFIVVGSSLAPTIVTNVSPDNPAYKRDFRNGQS